MKTITLIFIVLFSVTKLSYAQSPESLSSGFFSVYKDKSFSEALTSLYKTNPQAANREAERDSIDRQLRRVLNTTGKFLGYELISKKVASSRVVLLTYLASYDNKPLTFRILFYKPNNDWIFQNIKFDASIGEELERASKKWHNAPPL